MPPPKFTFKVPPGIGDISWCYQKLINLIPNRDISLQVCQDPPLRSADFVSILPGVTFLGYADNYHKMRKRLLPYSTNLSKLSPGTYAVSMNPHLESGQPLMTAFPTQKTHYRYPLNTAQWAAQAYSLAPDKGVLRLGFYCSSYAHRPDLGMW